MKTYFVNENNLILKVDSYKSGQYKMYPAGMNKLFSYAESRGGVYPSTVFFGLQYLLLRYLDRPVTVDDVNEANEFFKLHGVDFNYEGWMYIAKDLEGKLPVRIRAVPEGSVVPVSNILMSIESTDPKVPWIVNWLETLLLKIWYPTTVATQSHYLKQVIYESLVKTADDPDAEIAFKLHSFGYRGVSSEESAAIGGAAELLSFMGTDTLAGIVCTANYYDSEINGFSINASEHSCITSWGREHEVDAYSNMIDQFGKPGQLFACVSDSYDIFKAITDLWGGALKEKLIASGGTLVIRPDSGEPTKIVPECLKLMDKAFGHTINSKGYKVINHVKLIQGDGVNPTSIREIINAVIDCGYSMSNVAFGMGGASLQGSKENTINRDTQKFAFKASYAEFNGVGRDVFKDPVTDPGKQSKKGLLDLVYSEEEETYKTVRGFREDTIMKVVYENGVIVKQYNWDEVKKQLNDHRNK